MSDPRAPRPLDDLPVIDGRPESVDAVEGRSFDEPQRPSPVFVIVHTFRMVTTVVLPIIFAIVIPTTGAGEAVPFVAVILALIAAALLFVGVIGWSWLSWRRFTFQLTDTELRIDRGVVFRQTAHIPFDRIHSVDHSAGLVERMLGVVKLNVQTAGTNAKAEGSIEGLTLSVAEALQRELFRRARSMGAESATPTTRTDEDAGARRDIASSVSEMSSQVRGVFGGFDQDAPVSFEYKLPTKNLLLAAISSTQSWVAIIVFIAAGAQFLEFFQLYDRVGDIVRAVPVMEIALLSIGVLVITWIVSVISTTLKFGGFTVRRRGPRVEVDRGLLERKVAGIPVERIQSVRVGSGIIRRFLKYAEIELDTAGGLGKSDGSGEVPVNVVHPFIANADVPSFLARIAPEIDGIPDSIERLPRRVLRRYLFRWFLAALPMMALPIVTGAFAPRFVSAAIAVAVVVLVIFLVLGWQSFLSRGWATSSRTLVVTGGVTDRTMMIVPKRRIQWARVSQTPFQRIAGLATLTVTTAAAPHAAVRDMPVEIAQEIQRWTLPGSVRGVSSSPTPAKGS